MLPVHKQQMLSVSHTCYGIQQQQPLYAITIANASVKVTLINLGATLTGIYTPDKNGNKVNIVAGYDNLNLYSHNEYYLGCVVGRYANRIAAGRFVLDGQPVQLSVNNNGNHLHGGIQGLHTRVWHIDSFIENDEQAGVVLKCISADGEEGYPGQLRVQVQYLLDNNNRLSIHYFAAADARTPVNLTNHSYFNLTGFRNPLVTGHHLQVNAAGYTEKNEQNIPTGAILPVAGTALDFTIAHAIGDTIQQLPADKGYDHNYVLKLSASDSIITAAVLSEPETGRVLRVYTNQPGIQVYTANWWAGRPKEEGGNPFLPHGAVALETQAFPDSPNHAHFPCTIVNPGEPYRSATHFEFDVQP